MKNKLFLVMAYTPDSFREGLLRDLINKLKTLNQDILLVSHNQQPKDILDSVNYYLYDKENILIPSHHTEIFHILETEDMYSQTQLNVINLTNHGIAALKLLYSGLGLAKMLGYDKVIQIEFDTELNNPEYLLSLFDELNQYDCLFFSDRDTFVDLQLNGFNLNSYTYDELKYNEADLRFGMSRGYNLGMAEMVFLERLISPKKYFRFDRDHRDKHLIIDLTNKREVKIKYVLSPIYHKKNNTVGLFANNIDETNGLNYNIITNGNLYYNGHTKLTEWSYKPLCDFNVLKNMTFIINNEIVKHLDFEKEPELLNVLKDKSIIEFKNF